VECVNENSPTLSELGVVLDFHYNGRSKRVEAFENLVSSYDLDAIIACVARADDGPAMDESLIEPVVRILEIHHKLLEQLK
jgi:hypothetical protein